MPFPAESWKQAHEIAGRKNLDFVYHDYDTGHFGACAKDDLPGHFKAGAWIPHAVFSIKAGTPLEEIVAKEKEFLAEHPKLVKGTP
jgi:hypothetical protein